MPFKKYPTMINKKVENYMNFSRICFKGNKRIGVTLRFTSYCLIAYAQANEKKCFVTKDEKRFRCAVLNDLCLYISLSLCNRDGIIIGIKISI